MSRPVKIVIWVVVFAAFAGAGAIVAANTDPFPPGVEDPGARPTPTSSTPSPTGQPRLVTFAVDLQVESRHDLYVGGMCDTDWEASLRVVADESGSVAGEGDVQLVGEAVCSFGQAQIQAETIAVEVGGTLGDGVLRLTLVEVGRDPLGSKELGGFAKTLELIRPQIHLGGEGGGKELVSAVRGDGDRGKFLSESRFQVECVRSCREIS
jgi:hypothetical protein